MARDLHGIIQEIRELPALPTIVTEINRLVSDNESSADDLGELISADMTIAGKVLRVVNSAHFGFSRKITDIKAAIVAMGFQAVRDIAVSISVFESLGHKGKVVFDQYTPMEFMETIDPTYREDILFYEAEKQV